jgi:hypothetical protein
MKQLTIALILIFAIGGVAFADAIHGQCFGKGGEKCLKSNHTISTSWNSKKAYPDSGGRYYLDFGGSVDKRITVYCDGDSVGSVYVKGDEKFNVHCD